VSQSGCPGDEAGLSLPKGFCSSVFADGLSHARGVAVAPNGDVYVALEGTNPSRENLSTLPHASFAALRDTNDDGRADIIRRVGKLGNTGIGIFNGYLYVDEGREIVRYARPDSQLVPVRREVVVSGIPLYQHLARNFAFGADSSLYVNVGAATNSCQVIDRQRGSPGRDPCTELLDHAGIWRFRADKLNQAFSPSARFATGLRNSMGLAFSADGKLYATQHGRDQLHDNWPATFPNATYDAENPAEELMQVNKDDDFGWPYCYYAMDQAKLVEAPEYGGDGKKDSRCIDKKGPLIAFPGHWAPMSMMFYNGTAFPERYRHGMFIAFHGQWMPHPGDHPGARIVFQPAVNGMPSGTFETFAYGFAGANNKAMSQDTTVHRPVGLAMSPDGALFITDDAGGRIYKITYRPR
jgi:glucose/arabinose dehydrogenase